MELSVVVDGDVGHRVHARFVERVVDWRDARRHRGVAGMAFHIRTGSSSSSFEPDAPRASSEQRHSQPGSDRNPEESMTPVEPPASTSLLLRRNVHDAPFRGDGSSDRNDPRPGGTPRPAQSGQIRTSTGSDGCPTCAQTHTLRPKNHFTHSSRQ